MKKIFVGIIDLINIVFVVRDHRVERHQVLLNHTDSYLGSLNLVMISYHLLLQGVRQRPLEHHLVLIQSNQAVDLTANIYLHSGHLL